jgi:hypothetical protein
MQHRPRDILLVGSFAAPTAEAVFRTVSGALGNRVRRIPDGETGDRSQWIRWQVLAFRDNPSFTLDPNLKGSDYQTDFYMLRPGMTAGDVQYGPLGYAENALASYAVFSRLKGEGMIAPDCRFQISIPPPYNVLDRHVSPKDRLAAEVGYERKMLAEIDEIVAAVPKQELAIQWDAAHEVQNLEGAREGWFDTLEQEEDEIIDRLVRLGDHIPDGAELGYHLCYGDFGHRHVVEPKDTGLMVRLTNKLSERVRRPIQWIHMPVPRDRSDDAYFAPLNNLHLNPETELYLGLVHHSDGVAGTRRRIAAVAKVISEFGIATECGMGRRDPKTMFELLRIHAEVADIENVQ